MFYLCRHFYSNGKNVQNHLRSPSQGASDQQSSCKFLGGNAIPPSIVYLLSFVLRLILPLFVCVYVYSERYLDTEIFF